MVHRAQTMTRIVPAGVLAMFLALGAARGDDAATLKGAWKFTAVNAGGTPVPAEIVRTLELRISKEELELSGSALKETIKSKVTLDEKAKTFDFEPTSGPEKGKVSKGLYELTAVKADGSEKFALKIYFSQPGGERPKKIEDQVAEGHFLWILEKTK
jgi:uncharacterized protein (TIGR03067 family)